MRTADCRSQTGEVCALDDLLLATLIKIKVLTSPECFALIRSNSVFSSKKNKAMAEKCTLDLVRLSKL